jgi:hypothetical protein
MQQHNLEASVWECVTASTSDNIRLRSLVVCITGSYEGGLGFRFDTETGSPECVFRVFSQNIQVPETKVRKFSSLFFCLITRSFHSNLKDLKSTRKSRDNITNIWLLEKNKKN